MNEEIKLKERLKISCVHQFRLSPFLSMVVKEGLAVGATASVFIAGAIFALPLAVLVCLIAVVALPTSLLTHLIYWIVSAFLTPVLRAKEQKGWVLLRKWNCEREENKITKREDR